MGKRKVTVRIDDAKHANVTAAGGTVSQSAQFAPPLSGEGGDVEMDLKHLEGGVYTAAGGDVVQSTELTEPLETLTSLIGQNLTQQDQIEHLQELVAELRAQAEKPPEARNPSKIKMILDNIATYLGLASLAATQMEKAQKLFETVKSFLSGI